MAIDKLTSQSLAPTAISDKLGYTPASATTVASQISDLVAGAPAALDTLKELATALNNDSNYATTVTTALGTKVDKINITGGSVGSSTAVPVLTFNAQGQITAATTASLPYIRSDADTSFSGSLTASGGNFLKFAHANQTDTNDGKIGSALFGSGLNIVGTQTTAGTGRQIRLWGDVLTDSGSKFWHSGNQTTSFSGNGYISLPNGLIIQWCTGGAVASESDVTTSYPIAFPNACLNVIVGTYMPSGDRDGMFQMRYFDRFSVTARFNQFNSAGGTGYPTVFAVGY